MKYLITGGCGFLGTNIAMEVLRQGHELVLFDNLSRHGAQANLTWLGQHGKFNFMFGDVRCHDDCEIAISEHQPDIVFHFAGQVAMTTSLYRPRKDFEVNALGTLNLLEAVRHKCHHAAFIYSSTNKVYGDLEYYNYTESATRYIIEDKSCGISEDAQLDFHSPYGCSKGSADQYVLDYARMFGLKTAVFRHSSMYGGRQFFSSDQGWVGWFCQQAVRQANGDASSFTISGNGKQVRDLLHANDMVSLYLLAASEIAKISGHAFNIGGGMGNSMSVLELLQHLQIVVDVKLNWHHIPPRASDQRVFVADIRKVREFLGWEPRVGYQEGINSMLTWVRGMETADK